MPQILVVDDDRAIRASLSRALGLQGHTVTEAADGAAALQAIAVGRPDLVLLDVMMPRVGGLAVLRRVRQDDPELPVLLLTARGEPGDRVEGLDAGADDYVVKPFELAELLARVRALLRRAAPRDPGPDSLDEVVVAGVVLRPGVRRATYDGRDVPLTPTELALLELLLRNHDVVLSPATIYERIWGYDFGPESKNLAVFVSSLRAKLDAVGAPPLVVTVRGAGYVVRTS